MIVEATEFNTPRCKALYNGLVLLVLQSKARDSLVRYKLKDARTT